MYVGGGGGTETHPTWLTGYHLWPFQLLSHIHTVQLVALYAILPAGHFQGNAPQSDTPRA